MKSPEYIAHGTSSEKDAKEILEEGFRAEEGRATVSGDLIYAYEWATEKERRKGSKSKSEIGEEPGRLLIFEVPENKEVNYATHTGIELNESDKEISGYSSKYVGGRKQLGTYREGNIQERREKIEKAKNALAEICEEIKDYLAGFGIDSESIKSKEDLIKTIKPLELSKQTEILQKSAEFDTKLSAQKKTAEAPIDLGKENILMSLVPSPELGTKLGELRNEIRGLKKIDFETYVSELSEVIKKHQENFFADGIDVRSVLKIMLESTVEAEIMHMMRSLAGEVKRAKGYKIFNRGGDQVVEKAVDKNQLLQKLEKLEAVVQSEGFDMGMENLNRYIKANVKGLLEELKDDNT